MGKNTIFCGIDEAGVGSWVGRVYAAACILDPDRPIIGLADSKKLSARRRDKLYETITQRALAWAVGYASREEVDRLNILEATFLAMERAVNELAVKPHLIQIDGNRTPRGFPCLVEAVVNGDNLVPAIMAASIIAKVSRDRYMDELHKLYPIYRFDEHRGYGTATHAEMLYLNGPCPEHRTSYAPVQRAVQARTAPARRTARL